MSYPSARVGSLTKNGDEIVSGADTILIDPPVVPTITIKFQDKNLIFDEADISHGQQDDPDSDTGVMAQPTGPNGTYTPQDLARMKANNPNFGTGIDAQLQPNSTKPLPTDCSQIPVSVPYDMQLSPHFKLKDLSIGSTNSPVAFPYQIKAQNGLTVSQIVCNLKALATNPLESMANKFGRRNLLISSGFRTTTGASQHGAGQAADVHMPNLNADDFWAAAQWVQANVMYDQLILEIAGPISSGHSPWLHLSFKKEGPNRKQVLTWRGNKNYTPGLTRLF